MGSGIWMQGNEDGRGMMAQEHNDGQKMKSFSADTKFISGS